MVIDNEFFKARPFFSSKSMNKTLLTHLYRKKVFVYKFACVKFVGA